MKKLVVSICDDGEEVFVGIREDLNSAIDLIQSQSSIYFNSRYIIYSLSDGLSVRYIDNKLFLD